MVLATAVQLLAAVFGVLVLVLVLVDAQPASALQSVPYKVNFQGRLTDNSGNILTDGSYNVKFRLYDAASSGANQWEEDRVYGIPDHRVTVQNGLFNIQFGDVTALSPALFNRAATGDLWLEVELPTPATATGTSPVWTELPMTPRQPLASSPYAFNADQLDGLDAGAFVQLSPGAQQSGSINVTGTINSATGLALGVAGPSGTTGTLLFRNSAAAGTVTLQAGNTSASYTLTLPTGQAVGTKILQNDGSGNLSWVAAGGCNDCLLNDSGITDATNTIIPTTDVTGLTIRGTSAGSPTKSIFEVTNSTGTASYIKVDQNAALTIGSGSGTIQLTSTTTTLKRTASGTTTLDVSDAADTTLAVTNSGTGIANLTVDGGVSIGAGQTYKVNGTPITSAALSNNSDLAKLPTDNTFAGRQTYSANGAAGTPVLSLTGAPNAAATDSLIQLSAAITGGSTAGTYIGANPTSFSGDFANLQVGGGVRFKVNNYGDQTTGFTQLDGSTTTSANQNNASTSLALTSAANFDIGNYVKITSTDCGGTGISPCYAKITAKVTNTLTITPALKWASGAPVVEYHLPEIGGTDTAQTLDNRYGRGYFISGVATGNGTTYYSEEGVSSSLSSFDFLTSNVTTLNIGSSGTTVTVPGAFTVAGQSIVDGSGQINGARLQANTVANAALANSSLTVTAGTGLSGGGAVSLGSSTSLAVVYGSSSVSAVRGDTALTCASGTGNLSGGGTSITLGTGGTCGAIAISSTPSFTSLTVTGNASIGSGTFQPTADVSSAVIKQTSASSPTADIFNVQTANSGNVIQVTGPVANEAAVTIASIGGTRSLTLNSGSGTVNLGANVLKHTASGNTTIDLSDASNTTLVITNSAAGSASVSIDAGGSYTGAGAVNVSSGGATALGLDTGGGAAINIGAVSATSVVIGGNTTATITQKVANSSATAFTLQTAGGTNLLVADTTNNRLYVGVVDGNATLLVLDTKNSTGDPTEVDGAMYFNSATQSLRCGRDGAWSNCATNEISHAYNFEDDFMSGGVTTGTIGSQGWGLATTGTCAPVYNPTTGVALSHDHPGVFELLTTANNSACMLRMATANTVTAAADDVVKFSVAAGEATSNRHEIGLANFATAAASNSAPTSGVWWEAAPATNARWQFCYANNGTPTCSTNTNATPTITANAWVQLEIRIVSATAVDFIYNGTKVSLTGITVDLGGTNKLTPGIYENGLTNANHALYVDYFQWRGVVTTSGGR